MQACAEPQRTDDLPGIRESIAFGAGKTVLVIEDDLLALEALAGRLGAWGFDVLQAGSPETAAAEVRSASRIDLVITDFHLPFDANGIDAVRALQKAESRLEGTPVIVMSGDTSGVAAEAAARRPCRFCASRSCR